MVTQLTFLVDKDEFGVLSVELFQTPAGSKEVEDSEPVGFRRLEDGIDAQLAEELIEEYGVNEPIAAAVQRIVGDMPLDCWTELFPVAGIWL